METGEYYAVSTGPYADDEIHFKTKEEALSYAEFEREDGNNTISIAYIKWEKIEF